jgi:hypothetical protein
VAERKTTPNMGRTARPSPGETSPGKRFAYEMAFDSRFQGRRWNEVESELQAAYPAWLAENQLAGSDGAEWDRVKGEVHEAWDAALDVEHAKADPWSGQWDERAPEYRRMWEGRGGNAGGRWEDAEVGYRYADAMAMDPRFIGRPWDDIAPGLEAGFPTWAASHGYRIAEGENMWERLRDAIKDAWHHIKHRRSA